MSTEVRPAFAPTTRATFEDHTQETVTVAVDIVAAPGGVQGRTRTVEQIRAEVRVRQDRRMGVRVSWPADLLADLWRLPEAAPFLAEGTVKAVYTFLQQVRMTQRDLAGMVGQSQSEVSEIMAGRQVQAVAVLARIASGLCLPPGVFGLAPRPADPASPMPEAAAAPVAAPPGGRRQHCPTCRCMTPVVPLLADSGGPAGPPCWTGAEMRALRLCVRMSVREFADAIGVSDRAVSKWESRGAGWIPRPHSQAAADRILSQALPMQRARFSAWLTGQPSEPVAQLRRDTHTGSSTHSQDGVHVNGRHQPRSGPRG